MKSLADPCCGSPVDDHPPSLSKSAVLARNLRATSYMKTAWYLRIRSVTLLSQVFGICCVANPDPKDITVTPQQVIADFTTLVLTPVSLPDELADYTAAMGQFDSLIAAVLERTGLDLVPAPEYAAIWEGILDRAEALFDSATGERNEEAFDLARQQLFSRLIELYDPDAILYPEIWVVGAPFSNGVARWDGTSQALVGLGTRLIHAFGAWFSGSESHLPAGTVDALSLVVFVESIEGQEFYAKSGGIQVLEKVGSDLEDRRSVPVEEWFADRVRNHKAVELALAPLLSQASR
ncbi:MAG: hypothetical protein JSW71_16250 [Gemmatimonadota bacterium]|nr:MAG: hypothetical protein JSW71_16250 [Gemmatimonadota bacterium]